MKKLLIYLFLALPVVLSAQIPAGYYASANGKTGAALKTTLHNQIKGHTVHSYADLWTDYVTTDKRADGKVWDMYSTCTFTFGSSSAGGNQCGNYGSVCDCYNREHSFPKSWFNDASPMYSDIFHIYPTDGKVNGVRNNYPYGEVGNATWTDAKGLGKLGSAKSGLGYSGVVFEPADEYKGDFARTYFYMVTRYEDVVAGWYSNAEAKPTLNGTAYPAFNTWVIDMLLRWHANDPVSQKEVDRNNAVYSSVQGNRNPFIDHPEYADLIWGSTPPATTDVVPPVITVDSVTYANTVFDATITVVDALSGVQSVVVHIGSAADDTTKATYTLSDKGNGVYKVKFVAPFSFSPVYCTFVACDSVGNCAKLPYTIEGSTAAAANREVSFSIFPNPASTALRVDLAGDVLLQRVEIFDMSGTLLLVQEGQSSKVSLSSLRVNGMYVVKVVTDKGVGSQMFRLAR
ncbi:MAG: endonuclease [Prevotellaceae bacterium]|jgi:endonuclease I|nr:endonuclease [Prevotellaceae bacterium]